MIWQVTTLRVVWIEIHLIVSFWLCIASPPCGWCGLKFTIYADGLQISASPPCGWCGLKFLLCSTHKPPDCHHLAGGVDWNIYSLSRWNYIYVTTLRVVWIEIYMEELATSNKSVTTLRVVWIEITRLFYHDLRHLCHHLAGGVDWN